MVVLGFVTCNGLRPAGQEMRPNARATSDELLGHVCIERVRGLILVGVETYGLETVAQHSQPAPT
eukprot:776386-Lingulodinium_polyedra.AAC.1